MAKTTNDQLKSLNRVFRIITGKNKQNYINSHYKTTQKVHMERNVP